MGGNKGMGEASEDGPDMTNNGMGGSATSGGGSSPSSVNGKGKMMSEATLSTGGSAFAGVGAIALVAGVGFVAVRQYKSRAGYKIIDTTPLEEVTAEQQAPLIV